MGDALAPFHHRYLVAILPVRDYRVPSMPFEAALADVRCKIKTNENEATAFGALACISTILVRKKGLFAKTAPQLAEEPGLSRIMWIQDGVVVGSHSLEIAGAVEITLFVSAAGLGTDLTGLELIQSEELLTRKEIIKTAAQECLTSFAVDCTKRSDAGEKDIFDLSDNEAETTILGRISTGLRELWGSDVEPGSQDSKERLLRDLSLLPERLSKALTTTVEDTRAKS